MIDVSGLVKGYGGKKALNGLSFTVSKGSLMGLLGPNGAGKTSTMRIICGAIRPDSGSVKINGINVENNPIYIKSIIGYLPEIPPLYPELRVREQLEYVAKLHKTKSNIIKDLISAVSSKCGISDVKDKTVSSLSKGYKQRVGLAQAMINDPEILILDEPTIGLDPAQVIEMRDLIRSMSKDKTVILSSHILSEVQMICDDLVIIDRGLLVASGSYKDIAKKVSLGSIYEVLITSVDEDIISKISNLKGVASCKVLDNGIIRIGAEPEDDLRAVISRMIIDSGHDLIEIKKIDPSLEDVFIKLTSGKGVM